ncbi:MAG: hypothetical protein NTU97_00540 [Candidatus Magasanikbacteria bacterium]|nr:hypothetical protein [Candidatus Magasanikbacteria bacterium]
MDYVVVLFTPYTVQSGLVESILFDIRQATPFHVLMQRRISLTLQHVRQLYPKLVTADFFPRIVECFIGGESEFVLLAAEGIHGKVNSIKGKFRFEDGVALATGLRQKYKKDEGSFEFIFHSTDSNAESEETTKCFFGETEFSDAKNGVFF